MFVVLITQIQYHYILTAETHVLYRSGKDRLDSKHLLPAVPIAKLPASILDSVETCLNATGMKGYLQREGLLENSFTDAKFYVEKIRDLVPESFLTQLPNHCWPVDVRLQVTQSKDGNEIHGNYGDIKISFREKSVGQSAVGKPHYRHTTNAVDSLSVACIPEVFLAGFTKCGSTYLYSLLTQQHPRIAKPRVKEPLWWLQAQHFTHNTSRNALFLVRYLLTYKPLVTEMQQKHTLSLLSVDATPEKMHRWPQIEHGHPAVNYCLLPAVIPQVLPRAKFLLVMRNPTNMLYSSFWFSCTRKGGDVPSDVQPKGPDIFHERIVQKIKAFKLCMKDQTLPLAKCVLDITPNVFGPELPCGKSRLGMGLYYVHVHKWLSVIPRNRFLFLTLEELAADTNGAMAKVWVFLGLPHVTVHDTMPRNQQVKVDYHHNPQLAMRNDTRELLDEFFAPYNRMLADLVGDDMFLWKSPD